MHIRIAAQMVQPRAELAEPTAEKAEWEETGQKFSHFNQFLKLHNYFKNYFRF